MARCGAGDIVGIMKRLTILCAMAGAFAPFEQALAESVQMPNVTEPQGINLGITSFFDGFSGPPGFSYLGVLRFTNADSIKDNSGNSIAGFHNPQVSTLTLANHVSYTSPLHFLGATLGFNAILPIIWLRGKTDQPGASLVGNGTALGDLTFGPQLQFAPVIGEAGRPVFVQRFEVDVIAPTGQYKHNADLNQSAGYFSINPYWAASIFPVPKVELSWRLHYLYNFRNHDPASSYPTAFQGMPIDTTQAGQAAWTNFAASYEISPSIHLGINGYYFKQFTNDRINGTSVAGTREQVLGIGPGMFWQLTKTRALWINTYTETAVRNRAKNNIIVQTQVATSF